MYLSRLILNLRSRQVQREIADTYQMHRTVLRAFPKTLPKLERVLFRLEIQPRIGAPVLLVQSQTTPDWGWLIDTDYLSIETGLPLESENPAVKQVDLHLNTGQILTFRLCANPTVKKDRPGRKQGRRLGILDEAKQLEWLHRKLAEAGARLLSARTSNESWRSGVLYKDEKQHQLRYAGVQFEGLFQVEDPIRLEEAVANGIGSAKGFGFGLLSLAPG